MKKYILVFLLFSISLIDVLYSTTLNKCDIVGVLGRITSSQKLKVIGNTGILSSDDNLIILDLIDKNSPCQISYFNTYTSSKRFEIVDNKIFIPTFQGKNLSIYELSASSQIVPISYLETSNYISDVAIKNNCAYFAGNGLKIADVSDIHNPVLLGYYGTSGYTTSVELLTNLAYVSDSGSGIYVLEVSSPDSPKYITKVNRISNEVKISGNKLYSILSDTGVFVYDISIATSPVELSSITVKGIKPEIEINNNIAYTLSSESGLNIINVSISSSPVLISTITLNDSSVNGISVTDSYVYITSNDNGFYIIDVSISSAPVLITNYKMYLGAMGYIEGLVNSNLLLSRSNNNDRYFIDISTPAKLILKEKIELNISGISQVRYNENYAFLLSQSDSKMYVLDVVNKSSPVIVASIGTSGTPTDIEINGNYIYVLNGGNSIDIINITAPYNPVYERMINEKYDHISISSNTLFAMGTGITIKDISNPVVPVNLCNFTDCGMVYDMSSYNNYAYTSESSAGINYLCVYNIADRSNPVLIERTQGCGYNLIISSNYLYTGGAVFDISYPDYPYEIAESANAFYCENNGYVYSFDQNFGLIVLKPNLTQSESLLTTSLSNIVFNELPKQQTVTKSFDIINAGGKVIYGSISADPEWIKVEPDTFMIHDRITVNVTADNKILNRTSGVYVATITVNSNAGNANIDISATATCVLMKPNPYNSSIGNLTFFGDGIVPKDTKINIYTLSGDKIKALEAGDSTEIAWDGKDEAGKPVTSGIYIYTYESPKEKGVGKFTVIR